MSRTILAVAAAFLFAPAASAADHVFSLDGDNTKLTFTGSKAGGKHDGGFAKLKGTATVTDADLTTLKLEATIETDSLFSDDPKLTAHLKSPDFFSVKDNPKATFKSTKVEKTEKGYTITGDLTLLGKTKPVSMPATVTATAEKFTFTSDFQIDQTDWGMVYGKGKIDDIVKLKLTITAKK
jgi:polyisoprenoid-binding protein YceI